ncbi:membrane protein [Streptomyces phage Vorvolakos]|uniref:Uncharacterized protein n=3 Tax=Flowerpowervirus flowerpower TaxID=2846396 RepID=A0A2U8UP03_9CAUD|nr:hypothetical protein HWB61_gp26 [Streptomyces phage FlowerPower]QEA11277.1 hypothetical protein SEA_GEOSTIN_70 [Streptomyces phage Geostin]QFP94775.1 hypothetical protein SEA_FABIAN_74 [Streptomyces phage Fabian]QZD97121.1 membrane protein [Streptomyces phage RetrieverFever]UOW93286.1 membrane protein [Streptomyces phage Vorvolakos]AWN05156.1 hypothetical protein SEA_FLOWERPOWER_75 [Streptomyces phage FlowerPower]
MFENLKKTFNEQDDEGKAIMIGLLFIATLAALGVIALAWLIVKSMLPYLIGGAVLYGIGIWKFNFPAPKFIKKFL